MAQRSCKAAPSADTAVGPGEHYSGRCSAPGYTEFRRGPLEPAFPRRAGTGLGAAKVKVDLPIVRLDPQFYQLSS